MKKDLKGIFCVALLCGSNVIMSDAQAENYIYDLDKKVCGITDNQTYNGLAIDNVHGKSQNIVYDELKVNLNLQTGIANGINVSVADKDILGESLESAEALLHIKESADISIVNNSDRKSSFGINVTNGRKPINVVEGETNAALVFDGPVMINVAAENRTAFGIHSQSHRENSLNKLFFNSEIQINSSGEKGAQGIYLLSDTGANQELKFNKATSIEANSKRGNVFGIFSEARSGAVNTLNFDRVKLILASGNKEASNFGVFLDSGDTGSSNIVTVSNGLIYENYISGEGINALGAFCTENNTSRINIEGPTLIYTNGSNANSILAVGNGSEIHINKSGTSTVNIVGNVVTAEGATSLVTMPTPESYIRGKYDTDSISASSLAVNNQAVWEMTGNSSLTTLKADSGSIINMQADKGGFSTLHTLSFKGNGGIVRLDIDASRNNGSNDRIYIAGEHEGVHYIALYNIAPNSSIAGAEGAVLISVGNEKGEFRAKPNEGKLYWQVYDLEKKDSTTDGYATDWYLQGVNETGDLVVLPKREDTETAKDKEPSLKQEDTEIVKDKEPSPKQEDTEQADAQNSVTKSDDSEQGEHIGYTSSVAGIMSVNSLNYHIWRTANDSLLQRIGELRQHGDSEKGAWFKVSGSKIGRDGKFSFENKYNSYELGYDGVAKETDAVVRYQGMSLGYIDGSSSYVNGSGANRGRYLSFYSTDKYSNGHYLDFIVRLSSMDNDFRILDTKNNLISGEYNNIGAAVSAEYGLKSILSMDGMQNLRPSLP